MPSKEQKKCFLCPLLGVTKCPNCEVYYCTAEHAALHSDGSYCFPYKVHKVRKVPIKSGVIYSETLNNEYIERIHQMSYSDNGILQIFSSLIK